MGRNTGPRAQKIKGRLAVAGLGLLSRIPTRLADGLAELVGGVVSVLPFPATRIVRTNLSLCFPELPPKELRRLTRRSLVESVITGVEIAACWFRPDRALTRIRRITGERAAFDQAIAEGRPVVLLAPHLGCWEAGNFWFGQHYDFHALFKPSPLPAVDELVARARQRFGTTMYPATPRGLAGLVKALRGGGVTAILPDQVPARDAGRFAPFFGRPAWTGTLASKLIQRSGARAFVVFARRVPGIGLEIVLRHPDPDLYEDDLDTSLSGLNRSIEAAIREEPAQYLWSYKRFRRRPEGQPSVYA